MSYIIAVRKYVPDPTKNPTVPEFEYLPFDVINLTHSGVAHCYNLEPREVGDPVQPRIRGMQVWYNSDLWSVITYVDDETR